MIFQKCQTFPQDFCIPKMISAVAFLKFFSSPNCVKTYKKVIKNKFEMLAMSYMAEWINNGGLGFV